MSAAAMLPPDEVREKIERGKILVLAGAESLLEQLPAGRWIAGTIPYFMTEKGGQCCLDRIQVTELPDFVSAVEIRSYDEKEISRVYSDAPKNGVSFIIIPARSAVHFTFALQAPGYQLFAVRPLVGWIAGVHLEELGKRPPRVFNGTLPCPLNDSAIVMHVSLPKTKVADIGIINIFTPGTGDVITFPRDGFSAKTALINGQERDFGEYLREQQLDRRLPLVTDYHGVLINTSFREGEESTEAVEFYAPVLSGLKYKHARPVADYLSQFSARTPQGLEHQILFSCNCILNYLYSNLEGEKRGCVPGPITFGEIAYLLLNQTMVYLRIIDLPAWR